MFYRRRNETTAERNKLVVYCLQNPQRYIRLHNLRKNLSLGYCISINNGSSTYQIGCFPSKSMNMLQELREEAAMQTDVAVANLRVLIMGHKLVASLL